MALPSIRKGMSVVEAVDNRCCHTADAGSGQKQPAELVAAVLVVWKVVADAAAAGL